MSEMTDDQCSGVAAAILRFALSAKAPIRIVEDELCPPDNVYMKGYMKVGEIGMSPSMAVQLELWTKRVEEAMRP